jgi:hypothetical protein
VPVGYSNVVDSRHSASSVGLKAKTAAILARYTLALHHYHTNTRSIPDDRTGIYGPNRESIGVEYATYRSYTVGFCVGLISNNGRVSVQSTSSIGPLLIVGFRADTQYRSRSGEVYFKYRLCTEPVQHCYPMYAPCRLALLQHCPVN